MKKLIDFGLFIGLALCFFISFLFNMFIFQNENYALVGVVAGGFAFVMTFLLKESTDIKNQIFEVKQMLEKQQKNKEKEVGSGSDGDDKTTYTIHTRDNF
jgi:hypothetical protein